VKEEKQLINLFRRAMENASIEGHSKMQNNNQLAIIAIVAALALLGVVAVTIVTITLQQEAEARGCESGLPNSARAINAAKGRCFGH
jgi:hypothetical protein